MLLGTACRPLMFRVLGRGLVSFLLSTGPGPADGIRQGGHSLALDQSRCQLCDDSVHVLFAPACRRVLRPAPVTVTGVRVLGITLTALLTPPRSLLPPAAAGVPLVPDVEAPVGGGAGEGPGGGGGAGFRPRPHGARHRPGPHPAAEAVAGLELGLTAQQPRHVVQPAWSCNGRGEISTTIQHTPHCPSLNSLQSDE